MHPFYESMEKFERQSNFVINKSKFVLNTFTARHVNIDLLPIFLKHKL